MLTRLKFCDDYLPIASPSLDTEFCAIFFIFGVSEEQTNGLTALISTLMIIPTPYPMREGDFEWCDWSGDLLTPDSMFS